MPWVEKVAAALAERGKSTHSVFVEVDGVRFLVTPMEQRLALSLGDDATLGFARKHALVRDCLGLRVKLACTLAALEAACSSDAGELESSLAADVDLGCELMHELTLEMKDISSAGSLNEAKEISQYRKQLLQLVEQAEGRVGASPAGVVAEPVQAPSTTRPRPNAPPREQRHRPATKAKPRRGSWLLWVAMSALALLAGAVAVALYLGR
jgi:hypothetical protein